MNHRTNFSNFFLPKKKEQFLTTVLFFCIGAGIATAEARPSKYEERDCGVIVQFQDHIIGFEEGQDGADISKIVVADAKLREIFSQFHVVYSRQVLTRAKKEKIVQGKIRKMPNLANTYVITCENPEFVNPCIQALSDHPLVIYAEGNYMELVGWACPDPVDPYFERGFVDPYQWWISGARGDSSVHINIEPAWDITCGESTTTIGLFDQGVRTIHEDIGSRCTNIGGTTGSHGTNVYGVLAANANTVGLAGMVQEAEVVSWNINNFASISEYADSLISAVDDWDCDVLCTSTAVFTFGYTFAISSTFKNATDYAFDSGVPFVAAAGNREFSHLYQPGCIDEVIAVGASDTTDSFVDEFSGIGPNGIPDYNHGRLLDIIAPGEWMITTGANSNYDYYLASWGTTYSQPIVTGAIALMDGAIGELGISGYAAEDYEGMLYAFAKDLSSAGHDTLTGWGRIDVGRTIQNMTGRYSLLHDQETGAALTDSTEKFKASIFGFTSQGIKHGKGYRVKQFTVEQTVTWPQFANADSVFCWGMSNDSSGLRDFVRNWTFFYPDGEQNHLIFNRRMCYPDYSTIDDDSAIFKSYYYKVYYGLTDSVIAILGESNPDSVVFSYAVVGPDSIPDKNYLSEDVPPSSSWASLNFPNPFNPSTQIDYLVADNESWVKIGIYDSRGRLVTFVVNENKINGKHTAIWDGRDSGGKMQSAGVYIARVAIGSQFQVSRKLVLLK